MTAYGAVISLKNTIDNILNCSRFSLVGRSEQIIDVVDEELKSWKEILERLDDTSPSKNRKKVNALDRRIKDLIWEFEDSLESLLAQQIPPEVDTQFVSIDLQSLQKYVDSFIQTLNDMEKDYIRELHNMPQDEPISSMIGFGGTNPKMIGLSDLFQEAKTNIMRFSRFWMFALYGMAGVGKTTLAKKIYQDPEIQSIYERRAWVTVGRIPQPISRISRGILAQLCGITLTEGDETPGEYLEERWEEKDCLIVLDDVWETQVLDSLLCSIPNIRNGKIRILVTTRHLKVIIPIQLKYIFCHYAVRLLNEEESMELLCDKVFGDDSCPPQLHKAATKIAKNCEGLPLMIVTVADSLSKSQNRDPDYWDEVAEMRNSVFRDAYNEISKVLFPSYDYLPQYHKMPFLFMGVFPLGYETPLYKIIDMLTAEGLLLVTRKGKQSREESDWKCLRELASIYSLVLYIPTSTSMCCLYTAEMLKTCWLHSTWRYVCRGEASKNKFYHVFKRLDDGEEEAVKGQRGLCLENNTLFVIKEFCNSVRLNCASSARSLLFYGPYHQYPIPIDVSFRFLREIDALTQRFYTFPIEILILVQLKYLALTCNGELPTTISKLFNLRVLIIHPHINIRRCGAPSYVPIQIWDMQELEHIEILGKSLVAPHHDASLEKLSTLVGVNANIGTILELSRRTPNIRKLGVQVELMPLDDQIDLLSWLVCISKLERLDILRCSIINPVVKYGYVVPMTPSSLMFPRGLKKLHLSGMGFPWEYMDVIDSLPYLTVLKLKSYAFRGSKWESESESFLKLEYLLIEDSDLVQWKPGYGSFPELIYLSMKHCYKLEEIHRPASMHTNRSMRALKINLVNCNPLAFTCAKQFKPSPSGQLHVIATFSFDEKPTTIEFQRSGEDDDEDLGDNGEGNEVPHRSGEEDGGLMPEFRLRRARTL